MRGWVLAALPALLVVVVAVALGWGTFAERQYLRAAAAALDGGPDLGALGRAVDAATADPAQLADPTFLSVAQAAERQAAVLRNLNAPASRQGAQAFLVDAAGALDSLAATLRRAVSTGDPALLPAAAVAVERYAAAVERFAEVVAP